jgi:hypothetical protein
MQLVDIPDHTAHNLVEDKAEGIVLAELVGRRLPEGAVRAAAVDRNSVVEDIAVVSIIADHTWKKQQGHWSHIVERHIDVVLLRGVVEGAVAVVPVRETLSSLAVGEVVVVVADNWDPSGKKEEGKWYLRID